MKKISLILCAALFTVITAGSAAAFTQNEFTTAESLDAGMTQTGIHFTLGELGNRDYKSYYPAFRYGMGAFFEVGLKFGATSLDIGPEDKLGALLGVDVKYQLIKEDDGIPLDMAISLGFDNTLISGKNVSEVTFATILSKGFPLADRGYKLTPYGGIEMSSLNGSSQYVPKDDTHVYIFGGLEWKVSQKFMMVFEVKAGEDTLGGFGIKFEY